MKLSRLLVVSILGAGILAAQEAPSSSAPEGQGAPRQRPQRGERPSRGERSQGGERPARGEFQAGRGGDRERPRRGATTLFDSGQASTNAAPSSSSYELRGFFGVGDELEVSVRTAGSDSSRWIRVGKKSGDWFLESADSARGVAVLVVDGRKHVLRLQKEALVREAPAFAATPVAEEPAPAPAPAKSASERLREMRESMSPEQEEAFRRTMSARMQTLMTENPSIMQRPQDAAEARARRELMYGVLREAAEDASKLPNKQGVVAPLPADHEQLVREELTRVIPDPTDTPFSDRASGR